MRRSLCRCLWDPVPGDVRHRNRLDGGRRGVLTLPSNRSRSQQGATTSSRSDEVRCQRTCHPDLSASSEHHRPRFRSHAVTMMMHPAMNMIIDHVPESRARSITGSPWVALDTQHSSATLKRAHLPRGVPGAYQVRTRLFDAFSRCRKDLLRRWPSCGVPGTRTLVIS